MSIAFIGVNYKTPEKTLSWVRSICDKSVDCRVVVVDNSKKDNPLFIAIEL